MVLSLDVVTCYCVQDFNKCTIMYKAKFMQDAVLNLAQEHFMVFFFFLGTYTGPWRRHHLGYNKVSGHVN